MCFARFVLFKWLMVSFFWTGAVSTFSEKYPSSVLEDACLDTLQLLRKYKYPAESHYVVTEDKYILQMHRIPRPGAKPVLLQHGLEDTSATWILMGTQIGLGYYLYDVGGYDVWLGNVRGNRYSRNHSTLNPSTNKSFWRFSWHEIGIYDLPAMIDTVLAKTGREKLTYFGHSQGTTSFFVMASLRPKYNKKVHIMHALAPVAFMSHVKTPLLGIAKNFLNLYKDRRTEFLPSSDLVLKNCMSTQVAFDTCVYYLWQIIGKDQKQINMTMLPVVLGHLPGGANLKQIAHYIQMVGSGNFCQYDYGPRDNLRRYGRNIPPEYPIEKISAPIGLYYALNDFLSSEVDVQRLSKLLPNVVEDSLYPYKKWNHMSMLWAIDARELAHKRMLELTKQYDGTVVMTRRKPKLINPDTMTTESSVESSSVRKIEANASQSEWDTDFQSIDNSTDSVFL